MKNLESFNSEKFNSLESMDMTKIQGGGSEYTLTWTKTKDQADDECSDCDSGGFQ